MVKRELDGSVDEYQCIERFIYPMGLYITCKNVETWT